MRKEVIKFVSVCDFKYSSIYRYFLMPLHLNFIECAIGRTLGMSDEDFYSSAFFVFVGNFLESFML